MTSSSIAVTDRLIWLDGAFIPWAQAKLPIISPGLHYANAAFEGIRTYCGVPFRLCDHLTRLHYSAQSIGLQISYDVSELAAAIQMLIERESFQDAYLRPIAWRGGLDLRLSAPGSPTIVAIAGWPAPSILWDPDPAAISLYTSRWRRPSAGVLPEGAKVSAAYLIGCLAKQEADQHGYDDALLLDQEGFVSESTGTNVFLGSQADGLCTPIADSALNGITRQTVIHLARRRGIPVTECRISREQLAAADEVFITGTSLEITAINRIDNLRYSPGPMTAQLRADYGETVSARS